MKRYQRSRKAGAKLPPGVVCVTRPSRFSNPFRPYATVDVGASELGIAVAGVIRVECGDVENCLAWFRIHMRALRELYERAGVDFFEPIRGRDLACWCPLDAPCHADILLDLANRPHSTRRS
jgi:hypothetical protein